MPTNKSSRHLSILKICFCALFSALICVSTFISIPLPFGYFNLGDIMILLCVWNTAPLYGATAAALGSSLADILMGFTLYAPATFIIKALMAACANFMFRTIKKAIRVKQADILSRIISSFCAEAIMVTGYFLYEYILYGNGAFASVFGNLLQGVCAITVASAFGKLFERRVGYRLFPKT